MVETSLGKKNQRSDHRGNQLKRLTDRNVFRIQESGNIISKQIFFWKL